MVKLGPHHATAALSRRLALRLLSCAPLAAPPAALLATLPASAQDQIPKEGFVTPSGLRYFDFREGQSSETPKWGSLIRFHYVGYTVSSTGGELVEFDSTYDRREPYFTKHGNGQTIRGLEEAMHSMKAGGRRRVIVPAGQLSYITDKGPVPPKPGGREKMYKAVNDEQPLVFDVELVSVMDDLLDRGDYDDGALLGSQEACDAWSAGAGAAWGKWRAAAPPLWPWDVARSVARAPPAQATSRIGSHGCRPRRRRRSRSSHGRVRLRLTRPKPRPSEGAAAVKRRRAPRGLAGWRPRRGPLPP